MESPPLARSAVIVTDGKTRNNQTKRYRRSRLCSESSTRNNWLGSGLQAVGNSDISTHCQCLCRVVVPVADVQRRSELGLSPTNLLHRQLRKLPVKGSQVRPSNTSAWWQFLPFLIIKGQTISSFELPSQACIRTDSQKLTRDIIGSRIVTHMTFWVRK